MSTSHDTAGPTRTNRDCVTEPVHPSLMPVTALSAVLGPS
jgi:hypothetical protein